MSTQHTPEPTAYDLLLNAPDAQVKRCQLAFKAVAAGQWAEAAHFMRNAAEEEGTTAWSSEANAFAVACMQHVNPYRLVAENKTAGSYWHAAIAKATGEQA